MKTVLEVISATTDYFTRNQVESPRLNIEHILAHVLGKKRMDLYLEFDRPLHETELSPLRDMVRRRAQGEPLQHLLGTVEFMDLTLKCDARALIPRPETEQLCELLITQAKNVALPSVVDVGTGSGCIALALASAWPEASVTAVDVSPTALALAAENAERTGLKERVRFVQSDLLSAVEGPFALIVANLPYIPSREMESLQREVQRDPVLALDGGPEGLDMIFRLIQEAAQKLGPGGWIALEYHSSQTARILDSLNKQGFSDSRCVKDYQGNERFIFAQWPQK